jgi:hypothetical protein
VPIGIWSSRWRSGCAHWDLDWEEEDEEEMRKRWRRRKTILIKFNNPHLAGGKSMGKL